MGYFSADITIMQDAIMKVSDKINRDFVELENLQNSQKNCEQFSEKLYDFVKIKLFEFFKIKKPQNDIVLLDKDGVSIGESSSNFRYVISPICGFLNLVHAIPYFCVTILLQKKDKTTNEYKTVCGIVDNPVMNQTFITEDGRGSYVNSRRIRVSNRNKISDSIVAIKNSSDKNFISDCVKKFNNLTITDCEILNICNLASGKIDIVILSKTKNPVQEFGILMAKESGALIKNLDDYNIMCNEQLQSQL